MDEKKGPFISLLIIASTVVFLLLLSYLIPEYHDGSVSLKEYDLFSDLRMKDPPILVKTKISDTPKNPDTLKKISPSASELHNKELQDFARDTIGGLYHFLSSLKETKKTGKITRIAYFGDSMIEGDILTQDLRNNLQNVFGGQGVGFVPITTITAGFRQTIHQTFSNNWSTYSLILNPSPTNTLGISGFVFLPQSKTDSNQAAKSWVSFSPCPNYKSLESFHTLKLFYGESSGEKNYVDMRMEGKLMRLSLSGKSIVNTIMLNDSLPFKNISLNFQCDAPMKIYGASFESRTGLFLDNFSFRGNSGLPLTKISPAVFQGFNQTMKYDLIIIHYGLNVVNTNMTDYSWYQAGMIRVVNYLKSCFPQSSFLLISVGDKSYKNGMVYETDPAIPLLVEAQRKVAERTGVAFWNLYEGMGGYNSMLSWVDTIAPLANKDYAHLNFKGGKRVADMLFQHLMKEYENNNNLSRKIQ
jgi:hypothetical protein